MDRGLFVADPIAAGVDQRELGFYAGVVQEICHYGVVGLRYDMYDPNSDALDKRGAAAAVQPGDHDGLAADWPDASGRSRAPRPRVRHHPQRARTRCRRRATNLKANISRFACRCSYERAHARLDRDCAVACGPRLTACDVGQSPDRGLDEPIVVQGGQLISGDLPRRPHRRRKTRRQSVAGMPAFPPLSVLSVDGRKSEHPAWTWRASRSRATCPTTTRMRSACVCWTWARATGSSRPVHPTSQTPGALGFSMSR